jgi:hypothetical protein
MVTAAAGVAATEQAASVVAAAVTTVMVRLPRVIALLRAVARRSKAQPQPGAPVGA